VSCFVMNISATNVSLPIVKNSSLQQPVTEGVNAPSSNATESAETSINANVSISDAVSQTVQPENSIYERPLAKQTANELLNKNQNSQQSDSAGMLQPQEDATQQAEDKREQQGSENSINKQSSSDAELQEINNLASRDSEVNTHEQAHSAVGGKYAGAPNYSYETGPDGVKYAVSGEVAIDTSKIPNDAQATLQKAQQIKAAALAPVAPSGQDRRVAAKAEQMAAQARSDIFKENSVENEQLSQSSGRYDQVSTAEHFSDAQHLAMTKDVQQPIFERSQQINSRYQNSSISKEQPSLEIQI